MFSLKSLFGSDKFASSGLPVNRRQAVQWLKTLPQGDAYTQHAALADMLQRINNNLNIYSGDIIGLLESIDSIDHEIQQHQITLGQQYLRSQRLTPQLENKLWNAVYRAHQTIAQLYLSCLQRLIAQKNQPNYLVLAHGLCLRGLFNLGHQFKWRLARYATPNMEMWQTLHTFYRIAEEQGFDNRSAPVYDSSEHTCAGLFLRIEMLNLSHPGALSPEQIDLLDQWLLGITSEITLEHPPRPERHHYVTDLADSQGALPVSAKTFPTSCRAWDISTLLLHVQRTRASLLQPKAGSDSTARHRLRDALEYADKQWRPNQLGKLRKFPRHKSAQPLATVHGLADICAAIRHHGSENGISNETATEIRYTELIDLQLYGFVTETTKHRAQQLLNISGTSRAVPNMWDTENKSQNGYMIRYPGDNNTWLHLGSLLGVREDDADDWRVCVVRRLIKTETPLSLAGVQVIADHPLVLLLQPLQADLSADLSSSEQAMVRQGPSNALMTSPIQEGHFTVILESSNYIKSRIYKFQPTPAQPIIYFRLGRVLEKGDLWVHSEAIMLRDEAFVNNSTQ